MKILVEQVSAAELGLTERQMEVLALMMEGKSNKAICRELGVAETTVKIHVSAILKALNVANRTQAVIAAAALAKLGAAAAPIAGKASFATPAPVDDAAHPATLFTNKPSYEQAVHFCQTSDGIQLAYSQTGHGFPLVKTGHWMTHIEFDFESPVWRRFYRELSRDNTFYRYDARGNGLSDREVTDISFEHLVDDLEAVVDAAGIDRFALLGISQGCAVSIAYAVRHPERVSHLILLGGFAVGWKKRARTEMEKEAADAMLTLMRVGWGQENAAFRQMFTSQFIPGASKEQADWFNELQRVSTSPADAVRTLIANGEVDVTSLLPMVKAPTLVLHARHDARVPFESGRRLAAGIPGARFVPLESRNHIMLEGEPALPVFLNELRAFIGPKA